MTYEVIGTRNFLPLRGETRSPFHSVGVGGEYDQPGGGDVGVLCVDEETAQVVATALNVYREFIYARRRVPISRVPLMERLARVMDGERDPKPIEPPLIANNP